MIIRITGSKHTNKKKKSTTMTKPKYFLMWCDGILFKKSCWLQKV